MPKEYLLKSLVVLLHKNLLHVLEPIIGQFFYIKLAVHAFVGLRTF